MHTLLRGRAGRIGLALAALFVAGPRADCQQKLSREGYERVKTVKEAVEIVKGQLAADGKPEYAALLSEARVREAVRTAIKSYESRLLDEIEKKQAGTKERWEKEIKPACLRIADKGEWPPGCAFDGLYSLKGPGVSDEALHLRIHIDHSLGRFAVPIVDITFGKFAGG